MTILDRKKFASDEGTLLPLTIFYGCLSLVLVLLVVAATSLYLERKRLFTVADGAALAGAEAFDLSAVSVADGTARPTLRSGDVAEAVETYLDDIPVDGAGLEAVRVESARSSDGRSATVDLSAYWRPPIVTLFVPDGIRIEVTAVGRSVFY